MESISLQESFTKIEKQKSVVMLFLKKNMTIKCPLEQACDLLAETCSLVPMYKVLLEDTIPEEDARKLGIIKVPQVRFYHKGMFLGSITGQASSSEVYEKIIHFYK